MSDFSRGCALATAVLVAAACGPGHRQEKPPTPVRVQVAAPHRAGTGSRYSSAIEPVRRVDLAFRTPGYVAEVHRLEGSGDGRIVQEGDLITAGTVLVKLREADYDQKVQQARAALGEAEAMYAQASQAYKRASALYEQKSLARPDYEAAQAAQAAVEAKVKGARALVDEAELARGDSVMRAPLDGVVLRRFVQVGSLVGPGSPGFVIGDTSSVKVVFGAPDWMLPSLKVGSQQIVTTEALPGQPFAGTLTQVSRVANPASRLFDAEVTVANPRQLLKVGMVAALRLATAQAEGDDGPPIAPLTAILRSKTDARGYALFVIEQKEGKDVARLRNVTLGTAHGNEIAVTSGLKAGDRVVVRGATLLADGDPVNVIS